jgi:hypothetical protein
VPGAVTLTSCYRMAHVDPKADSDETADVWPRRLCLRTERAAIVEGLLLVLRAQRRFDALDQPLPLGRERPPRRTKTQTMGR